MNIYNAKKTWVVAATLVWCMASAQAQLKGAGSTFAANLYGSWSHVVAKAPDSRVDYDPVGSSGGVKAAQDRSVDFGASDRPLSRAALDQAGLIQFPTAIGGVVLLSNLAGIANDKVKLDGDTLAGIYLGRIKQWNDPALKALNPELSLPAIPIVPVFRSEGSGTSYVLSTYLSKMSPQFKSAVGVTSNLSAPGGKAAKTSADVAKIVRETVGAIGYFDYAYAIDLGMPTIQMKNQWGKFIVASRESLQVAMRAADWEKLLIDQDPTFEMDLTDAGCPGCWPIASTTYVLVPLKGRNGNSTRVLEFFEQALQQGDESATKEGYVPLPSRAKNVVSLAMRRWYGSLDKAGAGKPQRRSERDSDSHALALARL
jgi:phosphate transport system substrate-binding protein